MSATLQSPPCGPALTFYRALRDRAARKLLEHSNAWGPDYDDPAEDIERLIAVDSFKVREEL